MRGFSLLVIVALMISLSFLFSEGAIVQERSDFLKVSQTAAFVDKTLLIKAILQPGRRMFITAPPKFGKSTNLQMIKLFLSTNSLNMRKIKNIFRNLRIYQEDNTFFLKNFGKWPVLLLDLFTKTIFLCVNDVVKQLKVSIHRSYIEHTYLLKSPYLDEYDKFMCNKWMTAFKDMQEYDTSVGLRNLAKYLNKHFRKSVVVLVDGLDHVIDNAMIHVGDDLLFTRIVKLVSTSLENLLDSKTVDVETAVITSVSHLSSCGMIGIKNLETYPFLEDHQFSKFCGFSLDETNNLFGQSLIHINNLKIIEATELCGGYNSKGNVTLINPHYLSERMNLGAFDNNTKPPVFIKQLLYLLKFQNIENCMNSLLSEQTFKAIIYSTISKDKVIELKDLYQKMVEDVPDVNLFLTHLMELGYLSYVPSDSGSEEWSNVKLPNKEVYKSLFSVYKHYYTKECNLNATDIQDKGFNDFKLFLKSCKAEKKKNEKQGFWEKIKESIKSIFPKR